SRHGAPGARGARRPGAAGGRGAPGGAGCAPARAAAAGAPTAAATAGAAAAAAAAAAAVAAGAAVRRAVPAAAVTATVSLEPRNGGEVGVMKRALVVTDAVGDVEPVDEVLQRFGFAAPTEVATLEEALSRLRVEAYHLVIVPLA